MMTPQAIWNQREVIGVDSVHGGVQILQLRVQVGTAGAAHPSRLEFNHFANPPVYSLTEFDMPPQDIHEQFGFGIGSHVENGMMTDTSYWMKTQAIEARYWFIAML